ncbi:hypothetical protein X797_008052 [Metarhizium robertsii]|uniref:Uncharacterized protein n=1 Tax=Metarhizium robertsii TaxID=568076 RepID=A0A014P7G9_9HYPO|nr:hypothetical protein X797_008052 [Metarhizium robertsii]
MGAIEPAMVATLLCVRHVHQPWRPGQPEHYGVRTDTSLPRSGLSVRVATLNGAYSTSIMTEAVEGGNLGGQFKPGPIEARSPSVAPAGDGQVLRSTSANWETSMVEGPADHQLTSARVSRQVGASGAPSRLSGLPMRLCVRSNEGASPCYHNAMTCHADTRVCTYNYIMFDMGMSESETHQPDAQTRVRAPEYTSVAGLFLACINPAQDLVRRLPAGMTT